MIKFSGYTEIRIPYREEDIKQVYHLYCNVRIGMHYNNFNPKGLTQSALSHSNAFTTGSTLFRYQEGFSVCEEWLHTLSLPVHEFISADDLDYVISHIRKFYAKIKLS